MMLRFTSNSWWTRKAEATAACTSTDFMSCRFLTPSAKKPGQEDQGALYGFARPLVNAARKSGEWQVYDIRYLAPRRDRDENIIRQGSITAWLNGQLIHKQTRFGEPRSKYHPFRYGTTPYLQDHHSPTKFRNIWIRPLDQHGYLYAPKQCERENSVDSQTGRP